MKMGWWKRAGWLLAFGAIGALAAPPTAAAQQTDQDCRCVDGDGDAIDDCTCFRMPRFDDFVWPSSARPRLGISVSPAQGGGLDAQGAEVTRVMRDGPADRAGLREDDVITRIGGRSLFEPLPGDEEEDFDLDESLPVQRLLAIARTLEPGEEVEIEYLRDGTAAVATVEAADLSDRAFTMVLPDFDRDEMRVQVRELTEGIRDRARAYRYDGGWSGFTPDGDRPFVFTPFGSALGIRMIELTPGLGEYFGVEEGVLVTDVDEDSTLGLVPGDVIFRVGDREVTGPERVRRILASYADDEEITFRVQRNGSQIDVRGTLDD